jgi:hypothetical protein
MKYSDKRLLLDFFDCAAKLRDAKIVRSDRFLGDIGEWLCVENYGLVPEQSGRHPGFDGRIAGRKIQVKVHNSPERTNLEVGDPASYEELIVILGPRSRLRVEPSGENFHVYRYTSAEVRKLMKSPSGYYCARTALDSKAYDVVDFGE